MIIHKYIFKALAAVLVVACGVWAQVWNGTIDAEWYWDNTSQTEFTITKAEQLAGLAQLVNGGNSFSGKTIKLGTNIMLNNTTKWKNWSEVSPKNTWTPIGSNRSFSGTFDGGGYVVSGVYINKSNDDCQGLFGYVGSDATIKNLGVTASYIEGKCVGGLVGWNSGGRITNSYAIGYVSGITVGGLVGKNESGTITDCYAMGNVTGYTVGGLVGKNESGTITDCYATGNVTGGGGSIGGLIGDNNGIITNCYATGNVTASPNHYRSFIGGLIGNNDGTITNCYATGNVIGSYFWNGGNIGGLVGDNSGTIMDCYATGNVKGFEDKDKVSVGGLVGDNSGTITDCYATGNITGYTSTVGGLVGNNYSGTKTGIITNCYATGDVEGEKYVGGLVGINGGTITDCYATGNVSGTSNVGGLAGNNGGIITNSYATGKVSGTTGSTIGGLVGVDYKGTIENSYYDRQTSGQVDIDKGEPKSTVQMKQQITFVGWDFDRIWGINADKNSEYPYLQSNESVTKSVKVQERFTGQTKTGKRSSKN